MEVHEYLNWLKESLQPMYTPPHVPAGNDWLHCDRMSRQWGPRIRLFLEFDRDEYVTACWLHNADRSQAVRKRVFDEYSDTAKRYFTKWLYDMLHDSPFSLEARDRIVKAVEEHAKFADDPGDSTLLTALRIADKVDKLDDATMGIIGACAMRGVQVLAYDPDRPFDYASTEEGKLKSIYNDFFRQLEWYSMLPSDEARALVAADSMRFYVAFIRRFAKFVARVTGKENEVNKDLRHALGAYYKKFA